MAPGILLRYEGQQLLSVAFEKRSFNPHALSIINVDPLLTVCLNYALAFLSTIDLYSLEKKKACFIWFLCSRRKCHLRRVWKFGESFFSVPDNLENKVFEQAQNRLEYNESIVTCTKGIVYPIVTKNIFAELNHRNRYWFNNDTHESKQNASQFNLFLQSPRSSRWRWASCLTAPTSARATTSSSSAASGPIRPCWGWSGCITWV